MQRFQRIVGLLLCGLVLGSLVLCFASAAGAQDDEEGFRSIFNGRDLDGWKGDTRYWSVADGAITGYTETDGQLEGNSFLIWQGGKLADFELRVKFRLVGGNSGVQYRSRVLERFVVGGYQADFDDDENGRWVGVLYDEAGRGMLANRGEKLVIREDGEKESLSAAASEKEILAAFNKHDWNEYTIIARGNHLVQRINGVTTVDVTDGETSKAHAEGILALQLHEGPAMKVEFKDIRLKTFE